MTSIISLWNFILLLSQLALMFLSITFPIVPFLFLVKMELTVDYWFPFNACCEHWQSFPICLVPSWLEAYNCWYFNSLLINCCIYALISMISLEFDFLKIKKSNFKLIVKHERAEKLTKLINRHNQFLDISDKLQKIYWFHFCSICESVQWFCVYCFVVFRLSTANNVTIYGFYVPYLLMMAGQIMLLCLLGQKLINSSLAVADGIYFCG